MHCPEELHVRIRPTQKGVIPSLSGVATDAEKVESSSSAVWRQEGPRVRKTRHQNDFLDYQSANG